MKILCRKIKCRIIMNFSTSTLGSNKSKSLFEWWYCLPDFIKSSNMLWQFILWSIQGRAASFRWVRHIQPVRDVATSCRKNSYLGIAPSTVRQLSIIKQFDVTLPGFSLCFTFESLLETLIVLLNALDLISFVIHRIEQHLLHLTLSFCD